MYVQYVSKPLVSLVIDLGCDYTSESELEVTTNMWHDNWCIELAHVEPHVRANSLKIANERPTKS